MYFLLFQALDSSLITFLETQMPLESFIPNISQFLTSLFFNLSNYMFPPMRIRFLLQYFRCFFLNWQFQYGFIKLFNFDACYFVEVIALLKINVFAIFTEFLCCYKITIEIWVGYLCLKLFRLTKNFSNLDINVRQLVIIEDILTIFQIFTRRSIIYVVFIHFLSLQWCMTLKISNWQPQIRKKQLSQILLLSVIQCFFIFCQHFKGNPLNCRNINRISTKNVPIVIIHSRFRIAQIIMALPHQIIESKLGLPIIDFPCILQSFLKENQRFLMLERIDTDLAHKDKCFYLDPKLLSTRSRNQSLLKEKKRTLQLLTLIAYFSSHHNDKNKKFHLIQINSNIHDLNNIRDSNIEIERIQAIDFLLQKKDCVQHYALFLVWGVALFLLVVVYNELSVLGSFESFPSLCFYSLQLLEFSLLLLSTTLAVLLPTLPHQPLNNKLKHIIRIIPDQGILPVRFGPFPRQRVPQIPMRECVYLGADRIGDVNCCRCPVELVEACAWGWRQGEGFGELVRGVDCCGHQAFHGQVIQIYQDNFYGSDSLPITNFQKFALTFKTMDPKTVAPDYELFLKWFTSNGGHFKKISFPTRFPPTDYLGISASEDLRKNQVFLAVPKKLILCPTLARSSKLGPLLKKYGFNQNKSEENQFMVMIMFLAFLKLEGQESFFYPYLQALGKPDIMIDWQNDQISKIDDPYITPQFIQQLRHQLPQIFQKLYLISCAHPQIFPSPISQSLFQQCHNLLVSRCFGWGLPETMMVPFADFFNHDCSGVYHYVLNMQMENGVDGGEYVRKRVDHDVSLLRLGFGAVGKDAMDDREKFVKKYEHLLPAQLKSPQIDTKTKLKKVHMQLMQSTYDLDLHPSSNSQDNDSDSEEQHNESLPTQKQKHKKSLHQVSKKVKSLLQPPFQKPKPLSNRQFNSEITFNWWYNTNEHDNYFIVSAHKDIRKGEQIYNSYGRRSNRFLLIWYGFTHEKNKYDSVSFRFWDQSVYKKTGKLVFTRFLAEKDYRNGIAVGNQRYGYDMLSGEYRLKLDRICYETMAYLRMRIVKKKQKEFEHLLGYDDWAYRIYSLQLQKQVLDSYQTLLTHLWQSYQVDKKHPTLPNPAHNHFTTLLHQSTKAILNAHQKGLQLLKQVITRMLDGASVLEVFRSRLAFNQYEGSIEEKKEKRYENRKFVIGYFRMLGNMGGLEEKSKSSTKSST